MASPFLRRLAVNGAVGRLVALVERCDSSHPRALRILTYHRVSAAAPFARQMDHLAARYTVVSIPRVLNALEGGPELPQRSVLLTFDDAYRDFAEVAWPILRRRGFAAALFVPTSYPDGKLSRFWWDRLERAFAASPRREPLPTPFGQLPLATEADRARAHTVVKRWVKELPHVETLRATDEVCAALGAAAEPHDVLGWDELRALAAEGVTIGAHTRTHPRLDRVPFAEARAEILGSLVDLEREVPDGARVFAYPDGRFHDELVEVVRAAGVELAFTTRRGANDLLTGDRLRLRRVNMDAGDALEVFRAKLALGAVRLRAAIRLLDPPSAGERRSERANRRENRRARYVMRSLDALLTARLRAAGSEESTAPPRARGGTRPVNGSHYERMGRAVGRVLAVAPSLGVPLERALLDPARLPVRVARLELAGFGSGATVFKLEPAGGRPWALKVYRRTLGRDPGRLAAAARRYRRRYRQLRLSFGDAVVPAEFVVLHAPLRGVPAVACLQPWLEGRAHDLLAMDDARLIAFLDAHPALRPRFTAFARRVLAWRAQGLFPDLLGEGNLVALEAPDGMRLLLIDYGIFDARDNPVAGGKRAALEGIAKRLEVLMERVGADVVARV